MRKASLTIAAVCATLLWAGAAHAKRFTDNGDGTVTDHQSGLMWEKKTSAGSSGVHDVNNKYTWSNGTDFVPSGTAFTVFLATLNNGADLNAGFTPGGEPIDSPITGCFANHCDWRLPSIVELKSIRAAGCATGKNLPCIDPAFGSTQADTYLSATTRIDNTRLTRNVNFRDGSNQLLSKTDGAYVRAVRSDCR
jgi:hypothetical protein